MNLLSFGCSFFTPIFLFLFFHPCLVSGQDNYHFYSITSLNSNISQNSISDIEQDSYGMLWILNQAGVERFDGLKFTQHFELSHKDMIDEVATLSSIETCEDKVFIAASKGVYKLSYSSDSNRYTDPSKIYPGKIDRLFKGNSNESLYGIEGKKVLIFDVEGDKHYVYKSYQDSILSVVPYPNGYVVFTSKNIVIENVKQESRQTIKLSNINVISSVYSKYYNKIVFIDNKQIYSVDLATFKYRKENNALARQSIIEPVTILSDSKGQIWLGTRNTGIWISSSLTSQFDPFNRSFFLSNTIPSNRILKLFEGKDGVIYIGTDGGGLSIVTRATSFIHIYKSFNTDSVRPQLLINNDVWAIYQYASDTLLIGTDGNGLAIYNHINRSIRHIRFSPTSNSAPNTVISLAVNNCHVYAGTLSGLYRIGVENEIYSKRDLVKPLEGTINALHIKDSILYIGSADQGFYALNLITNVAQKLLHESKVNCISGFSTSDSILICTDSSIIVYDIHTRKSNEINQKVGKINCAFVDSRNYLWIGTNGNGLRIHRKHDVIAYTDKDFLPSNTIYSLLEDSIGNVWVSTNKGISRFMPVDDDYVVNSYNVNHGLQHNEFNYGSRYATANKNLLFFGGVNGLSELRVSNTGATKRTKKIPFMEVTYTNKDNFPEAYLLFFTSQNEKINPSFEGNKVELTIGVLDYKDPGNNQVVYALNSDSFVYCRTNRLILSLSAANERNKLVSGNNSLKFKVRTSDGTWSDIYTLHVHVQNSNATQRQISFTVLFLLLLMLLLIFIIWKNRKKEKEKGVITKLLDDQVRLNSINSQITESAIAEGIMNYLVKDLGFHYTSISIVNHLKGEINTEYVKGADASVLTERSRYKIYDSNDILPTLIRQAEKYSLLTDDNLKISWARVRGYEFRQYSTSREGKGTKLVHQSSFIGSEDGLIANTHDKEIVELNKSIFDHLNHSSYDRIFIPIVLKSELKRQSKAFPSHAVVGLVEVGYSNLNQSYLEQERFSTENVIQLHSFLSNVAHHIYELSLQKEIGDIRGELEKLAVSARERSVRTSYPSYLLFIEDALLLCIEKLGFDYGVLSFFSGDGDIVYYHPSGRTESQLLLLSSDRIKSNNFFNHGLHELNKKQFAMHQEIKEVKHNDFSELIVTNSSLHFPISYKTLKFGYISLYAKGRRVVDNYALKYIESYLFECAENYKAMKTEFTLSDLVLPVDVFGSPDNIFNPTSKKMIRFFNTQSIVSWYASSQSDNRVYEVVSTENLVHVKNLEVIRHVEIKEVSSKELGQQHPQIQVLSKVEMKRLSPTLYNFCHLPQNRFESAVFVPVILNGRLEAFTLIFSKIPDYPLYPEVEAMLKQLSKKISMAVQASKLAQTIIEVADSIDSGDIKQTLIRIAAQANEVLSCNLILIFRKVPGEDFRTKDGISGGDYNNIETIKAAKFSNERALYTNWIFQENKGHSLVGRPSMDNLLREVGYTSLKGTIWDSESIQSVVTEVIRVGNRPIGVMHFCYRTSRLEDLTSEYEKNLRSGFVQLSGLAIHLYDEIEEKKRFIKHQIQMTGPLLYSQELLSQLHNMNNVFLTIKGQFNLFYNSIRNKTNSPEKFYKVNEFVEKVDRSFTLLAKEFVKLEGFWQTKSIEVNDTFVSIEEILDSAVSYVKFQADEERIEIKLTYKKSIKELDSPTPMTFGDFSRLKHVFVNVLRNAIQAIASQRRKNGLIEIDYVQSSSFHKVSIIDNGKGISDDIKDQLFQLFGSFKANGTGLGLFACKSVMESYGGEIGFSDQKNKKGGATFFVKLINQQPQN